MRFFCWNSLRSFRSLTYSRSLVPVVFLAFSCGETAVEPDPSTPVDARVVSLRADDIANNNGALDVQVSFVPPSGLSPDGYDVFVVPSSDAASFDEGIANGVATARRLFVPAQVGSIRAAFPDGFVATDGGPIQEGVSYQVFVLTDAASSENADEVLSVGVSLTLANEDAVGTIAGPLNASGDIAITAAGDLMVADFGQALGNANGSNIFRITPAGVQTLFVAGQSGAAGNEVAPDGALLQSNISAGVVRRIEPNGTSSVLATGMLGPTGIAVDSAGVVYVGQCGDNTIRRIAVNGQVDVYSTSVSYNCPNGVTIGPDGTLYIGNFGDGRLFSVDSTGRPTSLATVAGGGIGHVQFNGGNVWVVSRGGHQVWRVALDGSQTLVAGSGTRGKRDGPALQAGFSLPNGIALTSNADTIYVNDLVSTTDVNGLNPVVVRRIVLAR